MERSTSRLKLMLISMWNASRSTSLGLDSRIRLWTPELRKTQSRSGYELTIIQVSMKLRYVGSRVQDLPSHKGIKFIFVRDIVFHTAGLVRSMLLEKCIETFLSAAHSDDFGTLFNELVSQGSTNSRGSPNEKDSIVWRRHDDSARTKRSKTKVS